MFCTCVLGHLRRTFLMSKMFSGFSLRSTGSKATTVLKPLKVKSISPKKANAFPKKKIGIRAKTATQIDDEDLDLWEDKAYAISKYRSKADRQLADMEIKRESIKKLAYARAKTIERLYFKKPDPPNLLTWSAKEQVRFLNEQYPEEWTIEKITDSFPVSKECIKKIISSRLRLHREEDIIQHDLEVQKNWNDIKKALENGQVDDEMYNNLKNITNECLISNASGINDLPKPIVKKKHERLGQFSLIVKDCLEQKEECSKERANLNEKLAKMSAVLFDTSQVFQKSLNLKLSTKKEAPISPNAVDNISDDTEDSCFSKYKDNVMYENLPKRDVENDQKLTFQKRENIQNSSNNVKYYVIGNSVYDKNGEFLYKKP